MTALLLLIAALFAYELWKASAAEGLTFERWSLGAAISLVLAAASGIVTGTLMVPVLTLIACLHIGWSLSPAR